MKWSLCILFCVGLVSAHPLPKNHFERTIEIRVDPTFLQIRYVLSLSEETMQFDGLKCLAADDIVQLRQDPRETFRKLYTVAKAEQLRRGFTVLLESKDVPLQLKKSETGWQDQHLRFTFVFEGLWTLKPGPNTFQFFDETPYVCNDGASSSDDADGPVTLTIRERNPNVFADFESDEPTRLHGKPREQLKPNEEVRRRTATAILTLPMIVPAEPDRIPSKEVKSPTNSMLPWLVGLCGVCVFAIGLLRLWLAYTNRTK